MAENNAIPYSSNSLYMGMYVLSNNYVALWGIWEYQQKPIDCIEK